MQRNVDFWVSIYSQYTTRQGLIHDAKYIDRVYEVLNLDAPEAQGSHFVREAKRHWREILLGLHRKYKQGHGKLPDDLTAEEKHVAEMFQDLNDPNKFANAANRKRLRFQLGQKDRFLDGLKASGQYLPVMEQIFRSEGLPVELTRLPFVESSFNVHARSKVGASGIWQFMRSTGKLFLKVNDAVDERNDPIRATEAAAKLLRMNFESLRTWPLAVTAYNHGRKGLMRAVRRVGSDELEDVVSDYKSRTFGFASSNFFTELLAAIEVERNAEKYFGKVERLHPIQSYEVRIPDYVPYENLVQLLKLNSSSIRDLNPGLTEAVFEGKRLIPAGYTLRLPQDPTLGSEAAARVFMAGYAEIPSVFKLRSQQRFIKYGRKYYGKTPTLKE